MTREEAIEILNQIYCDWRTEEEQEAIELAIKALVQGPIIDKIKAEIEKQEKWLMSAGYNAYNIDIAFRAIKSVLKESEVD